MEGSELEGRRINSKGRKCTPCALGSGVMKCSLHPVFYVLLGFSLPRRILLLLPSIRVKWLWISVSNCGRLKQPANLSAIFHRLSPPFLYFLSSSLPFFLFFTPFFVFFYPFFARQVKNKRNRRDKPLPFTRRRFNERLNTISKIFDCLPFLNFETSQVIKETIINSNR